MKEIRGLVKAAYKKFKFIPSRPKSGRNILSSSFQGYFQKGKRRIRFSQNKTLRLLTLKREF